MTLSCSVEGTGPGVLLVHGTGGDATTWGRVPALLARRHTVVTVDLPGSGTTPLLPAALEVPVLADELAATAADAGLSDHAVVGISLGAGLAVATAARHPGRVTRLAVLGGFARARRSLALRLATWAALQDCDPSALGPLLASLSFSDAFLSGLDDRAFAQLLDLAGGSGTPGAVAQLDLTRRLDVRAELARVAAPTLVVAPTADAFVSPVHSEELAEGIAGARLARLAGGHAVPLEQPDALVDLLLPFLAG